MHIVILLLVIIVLLMIFGPWLLVAIGALLVALFAAAVWVAQNIVFPILLVLAGLAAAGAVSAVLYFAYAGIKALLAKR